MRAASARRSSGSTALVTATGPNTFVSYTVRRESTEVVDGCRPVSKPPVMAALLTRMSSRPNSVSMYSAAAVIEAASVTSSRTKRTSPPSAASFSAAARPRSGSLAPSRTVTPRAASERAVS